MGVCDITVIRKRVISALMANRIGPYSGAVGTGSSTNSRYQVTQEITDTILEVDALVVQARLSNPGDPYRPQFMAASANIPNNDFVPAHIGAQGNIDVNDAAAKIAPSRSELASVIAHPTLYPNADGWAILEDSQLLYKGSTGNVYIPTFTKSTACQAPDVDELAEVLGSIGFLEKDGAISPEIYAYGANYFQAYLQSLTGKNVVLPEVEQAEKILMGQ